MVRARILAMSVAWVVISSSVISAQDLSRYRQFRLGMSLVEAAQQAGIAPEAPLLHQRPELIRELMWQPPRHPGSTLTGDSVRQVLLSFYDGQLFRIVVNYAWDRTEGLTVADMVEALSTTYGLATLPATEIGSPWFRVYSDSDKIVAHWEDPEYSLNLFRPSFTSTFGLAMVSKRLDAVAHAASVEAIRLDLQDAQKRAIERKQKQEDEDHARQEKLRLVNKATFLP